MELGGLRMAPGGTHGDIGDCVLKLEGGGVRRKEGDGVRNSLPDDDEM